MDLETKPYFLAENISISAIVMCPCTDRSYYGGSHTTLLHTTEGNINDIFENILAHNLWLYVPPIILILGSFGNILSFLTWSRKLFKQKPISAYFLTLAVVDSLALYTGLLRHWIIGLSGVDIRNNSSLGCKIHMFLVYWAITFASWILVVLTMDRLFHVKKPHFARQWFTHTTAYGFLIGFAIMCAFVDCHFFISFHLVPLESQYSSKLAYICTPKEAWVVFIGDVWPTLDYVFYSALPSIILLFCNIAIIIHVMKSPLVPLHITAAQKRYTNFNTMTTILMCVSMAFLVLTTPNAIFFIVQYLWLSGNPQTLAKSNLYFTVSCLLSYINNAANLLFYCVSGRQFRKELKHMVHSKKVTPQEKSKNLMSTIT